MQVSLQYAEEHLADLASAARCGEEIEIAEPGKTSLRLVVSAVCEEEKHGLLNSARGQIHLAKDWDSPEINSEIADSFEGSILFPESPRG